MSASSEELARWEKAARKDNPSFWSSAALVAVFDRLREVEAQLKEEREHGDNLAVECSGKEALKQKLAQIQQIALHGTNIAEDIQRIVELSRPRADI
jgi:hypothetical protein